MFYGCSQLSFLFNDRFETVEKWLKEASKDANHLYLVIFT